MNPSRFAVSAAFAANGLIIGCWAPLVPAIKEKLQITESDIGLMIFIGGASAMLAMTACSHLISRFGSAPVTRVSALLFAPSLIFFTYAPSFSWAAATFVWLFATAAVMDVAMNANAAELENHQDKPMMSSFHGFWSMGAMIGAAAGGPVIAWFGQVALGYAASVLVFMICLMTLPRLHEGQLHIDQKSDTIEDGQMPGKLQGFPPKMLAIYLLGLMTFITYTAEGAVIDWSALFLREEIGASITVSGLAFASFSLAMMLARFTGDAMKKSLGAVRLVQASAIVTLVGLLMVTASSNLPIIMLGFFLAGLGNANIVPVAFTAAANMPGLKPGVGISTAGFCGYVGLLFAPASLGFVAEHIGFRPIYLTFAILMTLVLLMAGLVKKREA